MQRALKNIQSYDMGYYKFISHILPNHSLMKHGCLCYETDEAVKHVLKSIGMYCNRIYSSKQLMFYLQDFKII